MSDATIQRLLIVTDAWHPQVNGVVRTLGNTCLHLNAMGVHVEFITPALFKTLPCPGDRGIALALATSARLKAMIGEINPDALHIATEGPLGWAARAAAIEQGWAHTTAYHTRFPEYLKARFGVPLAWSYPLMRRFHRHASAVLAPTPAIVDSLVQRGFGPVVHWSRGVDHDVFYPRVAQAPINQAHPIFLYAGRLAAEKNIDAFLQLDLPGQKWVAGDGPLAQTLKRRYPDVRFLGVLPANALALAYSQADVFVFPSLTDTFGLVMAEAMACGLPVAAFNVPGPIDVVGQSGAGVLSDDLRQACLACLTLDRAQALARAKQFSWPAASAQFYRALTPMRGPQPVYSPITTG